MSNFIYIPKRFSKDVYVTDRYAILFDLIADNLNWKITHDPSDVINSDVNIVMLFKTPQSESPSLNNIEFIYKIPDSTKIISYFTDIHIKEQKNKYLEKMEYILNRSNIILVSYYNAFIEKWKKFENKAIWFPHFYAPASRFNLPYNNNPIKKCLLIGEVHKHYYPLRHKVLSEKTKMIDYIKHPGYHIDIENIVQKDIPIRDNYAKKLNEYFCNITCCSRFQYTLAKYFEIPATGSLLIADSCDEINKLGFKDGINYIQINENNAMDIINEVLSKTENYDDIRKNGMCFIRNNFSVEKRFNQFIDILKDKNWE